MSHLGGSGALPTRAHLHDAPVRCTDPAVIDGTRKSKDTMRRTRQRGSCYPECNMHCPFKTRFFAIFLTD
jgi:hypothetical protein